MITLIHGEDITASRNYFFDLKQKHIEGVSVDDTAISATDLKQILFGQDLFGTKKTVFIDNLFSKKKSPKEIEQFAEIVSASSADVILWESKELTTRQVGLLKNTTTKVFKIPSTIFTLLDSIKPGNGKALIEQFHKTLKEKDAEFVLFMLERHVRTLLAISSLSESSKGGESKGIRQAQGKNGSSIESRMTGSVGMTISELSRMQPWQKDKLEKQAKLFSMQELLNLHHHLFKIDLAQKTGALTMPLSDTIDFFLLSI